MKPRCAKPRQPAETRLRILAAAQELSCETGPARVSLDAVAARAGVSKGGLLYHFPTKHALLRALVAEHVDEMRRAIERDAPGAMAAGDAPAAARAYFKMLRESLCDADPPPSGVFAAIAEDPEFIAPLREFREEILQEVFQRFPNPDRATLAYLACEGLVHLKLTDAQGLANATCDTAIREMERLLGTL